MCLDGGAIPRFHVGRKPVVGRGVDKNKRVALAPHLEALCNTAAATYECSDW